MIPSTLIYVHVFLYIQRTANLVKTYLFILKYIAHFYRQPRFTSATDVRYKFRR